MVTFLNQARMIVEQRIFNRPDKVYYHLKKTTKIKIFLSKAYTEKLYASPKTDLKNFHEALNDLRRHYTSNILYKTCGTLRSPGRGHLCCSQNHSKPK